MKDIRLSFSENQKNIEREFDKKRSSFKSKQIKKPINTIDNKENIIHTRNNEIIKEEDSNKYSSSNESKIKEKKDKYNKEQGKKFSLLKQNRIYQNKMVNIKNNEPIRLSLSNQNVDSDSSEKSSSSGKTDNGLDGSNFISNDVYTNNENQNQNNNYYDKTINIHNKSYNIYKENNKIVKELNDNIRNNMTVSNQNDNNEKTFKNFEQNMMLNLKQNYDIKDNIKKQYNVEKKNEKIQISPNQINKNTPSLLNTISKKSEKKIKDYISKALIFQNKDLKIKATRNADSNIKINAEKETNFSSYDGQRNLFNKSNNLYNNILGIKSEKKEKEIKISSDNKSIDNYNKDIYLDSDIFKKIKYIKDEEIIDRPLLLDRNIFKLDKNKGCLESKIIELEFFTKKKFDELVKEIKNFIPIHFNSHLKDYSLLIKK